jgi:hypothetical protein
MSSKYYFINRTFVIIFCFLLIANSALYFIFIKDANSIIRELIKEEKSLREEMERTYSESSAAEELEGNLQKANEEQEHFYNHILGTKEEKLLKIMEEIDSLAYRYNLPKSDISFSNKKLEKRNIIQFDIVFPLKGRYVDIRDFINEIEKSSNFLIINRIELISIEVDYINLNVHLQTYFSMPS